MICFFKKKKPKCVDPSICNPIVVNQTTYSIVVFKDRGLLYDAQVLKPGEAVGMSGKEIAGTVAPYSIHALVGDEKSLPTQTESIKNLLSTAVIPTAFVIGTLAAASSAGALAGSSVALGKVASGIVVRGKIIDSAALAAGSVLASQAAPVAEMLIAKHPDNFMTKSSQFMAGKRYVVVRGGVEEELRILTIPEGEFHKIRISGDVKEPRDTLQDTGEIKKPVETPQDTFKFQFLSSHKNENENNNNENNNEDKKNKNNRHRVFGMTKKNKTDESSNRKSNKSNKSNKNDRIKAPSETNTNNDNNHLMNILSFGRKDRDDGGK